MKFEQVDQFLFAQTNISKATNGGVSYNRMPLDGPYYEVGKIMRWFTKFLVVLTKISSCQYRSDFLSRVDGILKLRKHKGLRVYFY